VKAMVLKSLGTPLELQDLPIPQPRKNEVRVKVSACGVCRTDQHIIEGDLKNPKPDLILGHEIVGYVDKVGSKVFSLSVGQRVGIPWLASACGTCKFCRSSKENLCQKAQFTGFHINGGFAEYTIANELACYPLPVRYTDTSIAPLMCAGLIGYRSYRMAENSLRIGLYGFGAAAHIICQVAKHQNREIYAFTREGDKQAQNLALELGADWVGNSAESAPCKLDAAIIYAPSGSLVPRALQQLEAGGKVICAGIHMSAIPEFDYNILWGERSICSVANLTRQDGLEFLAIAAETPISTHTTIFTLEQANEALSLLSSGKLSGAAVLSVNN
jgi:alcohol dehydrogenase, propanol-preferring